VSGEPADQGLNIPQADARARLQTLAYTILSPKLGRRHRILIAHVAVDGAFSASEVVPDATYPVLRERVIRRTLATGRRRAVLAIRAGRPGAAQNPDPELLTAARAAYALQHLEGLDRNETHAVLASAGVGDPDTATTLADQISTP
jgi:hypothetical protein